MTRVAVVGSANADLIARVAVQPRPGETVLGTDLVTSAGGKGANQAVAAALQGADVAFVGAVGSDVLAETALTGLRGAGVGLDALEIATGPTGVALIAVDQHGENSIVVVPGANSAVDAALVARHAGVVREAGVVVVQGEIPVDGIAAAITTATGRLVLNLAPVRPLDAALLRRANPLVVNEHEGAAALAQLEAAASDGVVPAGDVGDAPEDGVAGETDEAHLVRRLVARGVPCVVMTLGARGACVAWRDGPAGEVRLDRVSSPRVEAIDTTGAGDAFVGALAAGLARGSDLLDAVRLAVRVGAFAVTRAGAQPSYPGLDDPLPEA